MIVLAIIALIAGAIAAFMFRRGGVYNPHMPSLDHLSTIPEPDVVPASVPPVQAPPSPKTAQQSVPNTNPDSYTYPWDSPAHNWHNVRVICDNAGLTLEQKNILCACVYQESRFMTNPKPNQNKDPQTGKVWSTDYGIVQVNDHFHIGAGKDFPSVEYVLNNPAKCVEWMVNIYKETGSLQPWSSYSTGAYKQWLAPDSPMWALSTSHA